MIARLPQLKKSCQKIEMLLVSRTRNIAQHCYLYLHNMEQSEGLKSNKSCLRVNMNHVAQPFPLLAPQVSLWKAGHGPRNKPIHSF